MTAVRIEDLGNGLHAIDAFMEGSPNRLSCYLFDTPERVLIEAGPSATRSHLVAALDALGIDDPATIVLTHIHIDHAGAAGHLAQRYPRARIGVHSSGVRHLVDPSRLWRSAARIYGDEQLAQMWGRVEPVDRSRLVVLDEGTRLPLGGGRTLDVLHTPGHAKHHVVFHEETSGGLFVGDSLGLCYPHGHFVLPQAPPPEFDPEEAARQMRRMAGLAPRFLGFAHFGPNYDVDVALEDAEERMWDWVDVVAGMAGLDDTDAARALETWTIARYVEIGYSEAEVTGYADRVFWPMQVAGIRRWLASRS